MVNYLWRINMYLIKWLYNEFKESAHDLIRDIGDTGEAFYYGYIKGDKWSKGYFKIYLHSTLRAPFRPFRQIKEGIVNLIKWFPVIWEDRDWDYSYMERILRHKLYMMEKFFYSKDVHIADADKVAKQIKECREILDLLDGDELSDEIYKEYYKKYPFNGINFEPTEEEKDRVEKGLPARWYTMINNDTDEQHEMFKKCSAQEEHWRKILREKLYITLMEESEGWWD